MTEVIVEYVIIISLIIFFILNITYSKVFYSINLLYKNFIYNINIYILTNVHDGRAARIGELPTSKPHQKCEKSHPNILTTT